MNDKITAHLLGGVDWLWYDICSVVVFEKS